MPCNITLYQHSEYRGKSQNFGSTKGNLDVDPKEVGRNSATSYKVNADESCLITGWTYPGLSADGRSRGRYLRGNEISFNRRRKWNDNNWNDDLDSIAIQTIPSAAPSQMQYHIAINNYTPHNFSDKGCGGCKWWPEVKDRGNYANANRDDVMVREGVTFRPCPGGTGYFNSASGVRCIYSKTDANALQTLYSNKNGISADPRASMHASLKNTFCGIADNIFKNPGGGTCLEQERGKEIAKQYCSVGDRIATDGNCTKDNLGNLYSEVAEAYCKGAGKSKDWCSCYNVTNGVCDTDSAAAGCSAKRQNYDRLVDATPQDYKNAWSDMEACFGGVCVGNKYKPEGYNNNCSKSVNICDFNFDFQSMADSQINTSCNIGTGEGGAPSPPSYPPGSLSEKLDQNFRSKLPKSLQSFIPVSVGELKTDSNKLLGVGGTGFSSIICIILIIVILVAGSAGGRKGRFRR
jgi:hypothetical protein